MSDAHWHGLAGTEARAGCETIVLAGNPNVGKSVVFNALTGTYVDVSNFPGTTVELTRGRLGKHDVVDTPGVYGVSSFNDEETVARDVILGADIVVNVVDAVHLERDLFLTLQLVDMGKRMVVALNMADEARRRGVGIDRDLLEDLLGVPVVETVAVQGKGFDELKAALGRARHGHADVEIESDLVEMASRVGSRADALMVLEGDPAVSERHGIAPGTQRDAVYLQRRHRVNDICGHVVSETNTGATFSARLSHAMMHPATGVPMLIVLLGVVYVVFGQLIAGKLVDFLRGTLFEGLYTPWIQGVVAHVFAPGTADVRAARRAVRGAHDDAGHPLWRYPAACDRLLPAALAPRGQRIPAEDRRAHRPLAHGSGTQRSRGHPADTRVGLRDDGDAHDAHPRQPPRALHRHRAHGGGGALLGAARDRRRAHGDGGADLYRGLLRDPARRVRGSRHRAQPSRTRPVDRAAHRPPEPEDPAARQHRAQDRHQGLELHDGGRAVLLGRHALSRRATGERSARVDHPGGRSPSCTDGSACRHRRRRRSSWA